MSSHKPAELDQTALEISEERRRNLRFAFTATVEAIENKTGTKVTGRTSDLSLGGCYVDTLSPFPVGSDAKVRIQKGNVTFEAQVRVIFSAIGMGMGLAFVSAQPKQVRIFQKWLLEISGKSVPAEDSKDAVEFASPEKTQTMNNVVLSDLILTLIEKNVLTKNEGKALLRKLFR
jgi:PilZ domain